MRFLGIFWLSETQKRLRDMRFTPTIFSQLVEPLDRRRFEAIVARWNADAYDKSFRSWDHLMALIHAQLSRRDVSARADGQLERPRQRPLSPCVAAKSRAPPSPTPTRAGRSKCSPRPWRWSPPDRPLDPRRGQKTAAPDRFHAHPVGQTVRLGQVQRPHPRHEGPCRLRSRPRSAAHPRHHRRQRQRRPDRPNSSRSKPASPMSSTRATAITAGGRAIHAAEAFFVTRPKTNMGLTVKTERQCGPSRGEGFTVIGDQEVAFSSKGDSKLDDPAAPHRDSARRGRKDDHRRSPTT